MSTHLRAHTGTGTPPARPATSYSAHSTIRRVTPFPDSLSEALEQGFVAHSTPRRNARSGEATRETQKRGEYFTTNEAAEARGGHNKRPLKSPTNHPVSRQITPSRIPQPTSTTAGLRRSHAGRISPSKRSTPRQHRPLVTPSPLAQTSSIQDASTAGTVAALGLAMPEHAPPAVPDEEKQRLREFTLFPADETDPFTTHANSPFQKDATNPTLPAVRQENTTHQTSTLQLEDPDAITPAPARTYGAYDPGSPPMRTQGSIVPTKPNLPRHPSNTSWASQATFSTPGRDEMERKRAQLSVGNEGPFGSATGMQELAERRRRVSEAGRRSRGSEGSKKEEGARGACRCVVM
ncbi:hypothetical protein N0V90_000122 [Kalmusia sp. IMI 367209]|nr:hypothetical protein N0V90_000122 [Kalmusia sp. IMI 367209]